MLDLPAPPIISALSGQHWIFTGSPSTVDMLQPDTAAWQGHPAGTPAGCGLPINMESHIACCFPSLHFKNLVQWDYHTPSPSRLYHDNFGHAKTLTHTIYGRKIAGNHHGPEIKTHKCKTTIFLNMFLSPNPMSLTKETHVFSRDPG